jgi:ATP-binding cassette subfamily F protein 3
MSDASKASAFVQFNSVSLAFGELDILKDVNIYLSSKSRAALCGANGSGKSTLLKVIAGSIESDTGSRAVQKGCNIVYLPQSGIVHGGNTLREELETAYSRITTLETNAESIRTELAARKSDDRQTQLLIEEQHRLSEEIENSGYYMREREIQTVITGLGFSAADIDKSCGVFSGGYQMRIALAKTLLSKPDIMLLDEPTNYLDIEARNFLQKTLLTFSGGYILVSHDKYFLDSTVSEVYELFQGGLKRYAGNYSSYEALRKQEIESLKKILKAQQEEIAKLDSLINRFRYKAGKAAFAQELIKRRDKIIPVQLPESFKKINIAFPPPPHSGQKVLELTGLGKAYGEHTVLRSLDLLVEKGERLVVVGMNGAGKTTLLRIIAGRDTDYTGSVKYGAGVCVGYYSQDSAELLRGNISVEKFLEQDAPVALMPRIRDMLGAFLFRGDDVYKSLDVLSGGEKSRLALLSMFLKPMNLLVLDEPTNHLDMLSKDVLQAALEKFDGTVIFVSHDRAFMEALSTKTLALSANAQPLLYYGNYAYYIEKTETPAAMPAPLFVAQKNREVGMPGDKAKRELAKIQEAEKRRKEKQEAAIIAEIDALEADKAAALAELAKPEVYSSGDAARNVQKKLAAIEARLEAAHTRWEALA